MFKQSFQRVAFVISAVFCLCLATNAQATAGFICGAPPLKKGDEGKELEVNFWVLNVSGDPFSVMDVQYAIDAMVEKNRKFFSVRTPRVHFFENEADLLVETIRQSFPNYSSWGTIIVLGDASPEIEATGSSKNYTVVSTPDWRTRNTALAEILLKETDDAYYTVAAGHALQMALMGQSDRNLNVPSIVTDQHILAGLK